MFPKIAARASLFLSAVAVSMHTSYAAMLPRCLASSNLVRTSLSAIVVSAAVMGLARAIQCHIRLNCFAQRAAAHWSWRFGGGLFLFVGVSSSARSVPWPLALPGEPLMALPDAGDVDWLGIASAVRCQQCGR